MRALTRSRARRIAVVLTVAVSLGALTACGGDEDSPVEAARAAAEEFAAAFGSGDYEAACGELTEALRAELGGDGCPDQIAQVAGEGGDVEIAITNVRVSGPKAVAEIEVSRPGSPPRESSIDLVQADGVWQVSGLGD